MMFNLQDYQPQAHRQIPVYFGQKILIMDVLHFVMPTATPDLMVHGRLSTPEPGNRANMFYVSCRSQQTCKTHVPEVVLLVVMQHCMLELSPCATCLICPTGDCGAIYDTLTSGGFNPTTQKSCFYHQ